MNLEFDYYITPDGIQFDFNDYHTVFSMSDQGYGMPALDVKTQRGAFQHGSTVLNYFLEPRVITVIISVDPRCLDNHWNWRTALLNTFRPNRQVSAAFSTGILRKVLPNGDVRDIDVLPIQGPSFSRDRSQEFTYNRIEEAIQFMAFNPTFYDPTSSSIDTTAGASSELVFPFFFDPADIEGLLFATTVIDDTFYIDYTGTWLSYPVIRFTGPISGCAVENITTDERIELDYNVPLGDIITVDTTPGVKTVTDASGANKIGVLTTDSDLATFHIAPEPEASEGRNELLFTGSGITPAVTKIELEYYTRFIGI